MWYLSLFNPIQRDIAMDSWNFPLYLLLILATWSWWVLHQFRDPWLSISHSSFLQDLWAGWALLSAECFLIGETAHGDEAAPLAVGLVFFTWRALTWAPSFTPLVKSCSKFSRGSKCSIWFPLGRKDAYKSCHTWLWITGTSHAIFLSCLFFF